MLLNRAHGILVQSIRTILFNLHKFRLIRILAWELNKIQLDNYVTVNHGGYSLKICAPNELTLNRALTFSTKEPDTLEWISSFPSGAIFWDIGANIGLYSLWAAIDRNIAVYSFEPVPSNLEMLERNILMNQLETLITIVPLPLTNTTGLQRLNLPSIEYGVSHVSFGVNYDFEGKKQTPAISLQTIGITWKHVCEHFSVQNPTHVKIDVDGIEHLVLEGSGSYIQSVREVLVEVNYNFEDQLVSVARTLSESGFFLAQSNNSLPHADLSHSETRNQIWINKRYINNQSGVKIV